MASFRTRYDDNTFYSIMAFVSFSPNITHSIYSLPYFVFVVFRFPLLFIIDEHYLRAIKTRYLWQTRVHIQPLLSPPTTNKTYRVLQRICSIPGLHDSEEL